MTSCPSCDRENPEGARFCAFCGTPLEAAVPAREERKVVSVVFVDLVGHTARSESSDPEDVRALLAPYHAKARAHIERFGGTVEKFIGDAVMAVFGAPVAHEDDAERAVRAALAVRDAFLEEQLDVRIAVNTGEALVTLGARPEAGEAMVAGDVVNTAARLQSAAPVNGVLVGAATREATQRVIEFREAPPIDAKGKAAPVEAWEALSPRARQGIDAQQSAATPLVGRDAERRALLDAVDRAAHDRSLQLVTLVGAPGMGKSRLVLEVYGELDVRPGLVATWRQGRALAYGGGAFGAIADVVRAEAGILETDDPDIAAERLRVAVDGLTEDEAERAWLHRRLLPLVAEQAEQASRDESYGAWQRFFELIAERLPLVLVLEDLHWADDGTLDFVEHLADWSADSPLFILGTGRPELFERRPGWGGGRVNSQTISLAPLDDESTARLLAHVIGRAVVDATTQQAVLAQAGGNPLYAEEFARLVAERGVAGEVPATVQGVIAARLDVLRAEEKAFLQDAAVLGKVFWRGGVAALGSPAADDVILSLTRKDILRRARTSSVAGETELAFRHALVRDVAYAQIPRARRAEKHRLAAEWIASTSSGRPDLVAHHYVEAIGLARASGGESDALVGPAVDALVAAGARSLKLGAPDDALASLEQALELGGDDVRLLLEAEHVAQQTQAGSGEHGARALELATAAGDRASMARALRHLGRARWDEGDVAGADALIERAVAVGREAGDDASLATTLEAHARSLSTGGRRAEALTFAREALALAERAGLAAVAIGAQTTIGTELGAGGAPEAPDMLRAAARRAADEGDLDAVMRARNNLQYILWRAGELATAEREANETREFFAPYRLPRAEGWVSANAASSLVQLGRWDEALEMADRYHRALRGRRFYLDPHLEMALTMIRFARDEPEPFDSLEAHVDPSADLRDAQSLGTPAMWLAYYYALAGRADEAAAISRKLASTEPEVREHAAAVFGAAGQLSVIAGVDLLAGVVATGGWFRANTAFVREGFPAGVRALDELGARGDAAAARVLALKTGHAEEGWAEDVEAFAREVGATRWLRDLDELEATRRSA